MPDSPAPDAPVSSEVERLIHEPATTCLNCGATLPGAFCPACGQKAQAARQPVGTLVRETFTEMFGLDGRFWRSVGALLVRPGHLTREYVAGRRMRYLRPLRLYLTSTLAFFFLLSVLDPAGRLERQLAESSGADSLVVPARRIAEIDSALAAARADSADASAAPPDSSVAGAPGGWEADVEGIVLDSEHRRRRRMALERRVLAGMPPDSALSAVAVDRAVSALASPAEGEIYVGSVDGALDRGAIARIMRATNRADMARETSALVRGTVSRIPTAMFLLLPLFALLLKLLYARREWYYAEHVVFALHTHAFAFFVFSLVLLAYVWPGASEGMQLGAIQGAGLVLPLYFLLAQKRVYGQSWPKTLAKASLLGLGYGLLLTAGLVAVAMLVALQ